jgi:hypothetical protein
MDDIRNTLTDKNRDEISNRMKDAVAKAYYDIEKRL